MTTRELTLWSIEDAAEIYSDGLRMNDRDAEASIKAWKVEIERLRAENTSLWERVKRWEPLADPNSVQSGKI